MKKGRRIFALIIVLTILFHYLLPSSGFADDPTKKLGRGVANTALGWVTLFTTVQDVGESDGIFAAVTYGIFSGICKAVQRELVGIYETITFPMPWPEGYKPILTKPEFPLGKEAKE